jgi:hypothetical protein
MIEWGKLVSQGRAKAYGVPWTSEEAVAVSQGIPADYVRQGILTVEEYNKVKDLPVDKRTKEELMKEAQDKGIAVTPEATEESLKQVIEAKKPKKIAKKIKK